MVELYFHDGMRDIFVFECLIIHLTRPISDYIKIKAIENELVTLRMEKQMLETKEKELLNQIFLITSNK